MYFIAQDKAVTFVWVFLFTQTHLWLVSIQMHNSENSYTSCKETFKNNPAFGVVAWQ